MDHRIRIVGLFVPLGLAFPACGATSNLDGLLRNSPFDAAPAVAANGAALELRGVLVDGGEYFFSLYDPSTRASMWVGLNETGNPFTVQSYDTAKGLAQVAYKGRTLSLALKQAKVVALAANPVANAPAAAPSAPVNVSSAANQNEAARLTAIVEEIRRRRALRAQPGQVIEKPALPKNQ